MENITDRIQDYVDGHLQGEELAYFENRMAVDEELRNLVSLHKEVQAIINSRLESEENVLRSNLVNARANMSDVPTSGKTFKLYLPIAAAACLLVFFGLFLFRGGDHALYELPQMQSEIVRGQAGDVSYEDAVKAFNNKSYGEARTMLNGLIASDSTVVQYQYYAALTYFGEEDWPSTIRELTAIAQGKSVFADEAKYYLAVAYWKSGETTKAIELANQIPDIGKLGEKTRKLLGEME